MREYLLLHLNRFFTWVVGHKHSNICVGSRGNGKGHAVGVIGGVQGNNVILVVLHFRQPVDYKLVRLSRRKTDIHKLFPQELGGILALYAEALAVIKVCSALGFPVKAVVLLSVLVVKSTVRLCGNLSAVIVFGIGAGKLSAVLEINSYAYFGFLLGVKVDNGLCVIA